MTTREMWRTEAGTTLTAEIGVMRLVVEMPRETGGSVRFQVLRRGNTEDPDELIGSGVRPGRARGDGGGGGNGDRVALSRLDAGKIGALPQAPPKADPLETIDNK